MVEAEVSRTNEAIDNAVVSTLQVGEVVPGGRGSRSAHSLDFSKLHFDDEDSDIIRKTNLATESRCPAEDGVHKTFGRKRKTIL